MIIIILVAKLILNLFIIGLFLYSKLLPYKDRLMGQYKGLFGFFESIFAPASTFIRSIVKPVQVGQNLFVDVSQIILLMVFLVVYEFI